MCARACTRERERGGGLFLSLNLPLTSSCLPECLGASGPPELYAFSLSAHCFAWGLISAFIFIFLFHYTTLMFSLFCICFSPIAFCSFQHPLHRMYRFLKVKMFMSIVKCFSECVIEKKREPGQKAT